MAKQAVISALEEVFGEYVLNISKENLRIAALRGKLKLEHVQLDGEVLGSMILGVVGLEGFGILSCSAESVKISVPWSNLEREPTKFEIKGIHLVCVPLVPSTAHKLYGQGTQVDPRCTLRTRAKRLTLSRLERLFWNGQIPNEGPVMKRIQRAVREVERDQRRKKDGRKKKNAIGALPDDDDDVMASEGKEMENALEKLVGSEDTPELPRDWKVKLREKVLRNMVASMENIHIRCEVAEGGLAFVPKPLRPASPNAHKPPEERAFAFGFTIEKFFVRTANEGWKVGSHDTKNPVDGSAMSSVKGHLGPNEYVVKNNKIGFFQKLSMYWDDEPPVLISETDILRGNFRKLSPDKLQIRIVDAMNAMFYKQEPGDSVRQSLGVSSATKESQLDLDKPHEYVCENFEAEVRVRTSDREIPGPISCSADVMPFAWTMNIRQHQYVQYRLLQTAIKSQQRFDTMLRQRPKLSPKEDAKAWWQYAIACVTSRPNSRPWSDVKVIVENRNRYIELIVKKNTRKTDENGYHAGLSEAESSELLVLEELLPIEAMNAFHLLALRRAYLMKTNPDLVYSSKDRPRKSWGGLGRFRFSSSRKRSGSLEKPGSPVPPANPPYSRESSSITTDAEDELGEQSGHDSSKSLSLLESMTLRLGNKVWFIDWRLHDAALNVVLASPTDETAIAHFVIRSSGNIRSFGKGKRDFIFDITQCDMLHHEETVLFVRPSDDDIITETDVDDDLEETLGKLVPKTPSSRRGKAPLDGLPDLEYSSSFLELPPDGVICRVAHAKNGPDRNYSVSSHPLNFIWKSGLLDELIDFFVRHAEEVKSDLADYVRNAATPLARKAQLALLSPGSFAFHMNSAAPKIWLPVGSKEGGVLLLDAGFVRVAGRKGEGESAMAWDVKGQSIHASYTRGRIYDAYMGFISPNFKESLHRPETTVISPFNISVDTSHESEGEPKSGVGQTLTKAVDVVVSPVCLNLVDAEVLARSFGKWYLRSIRRANRRASNQVVGQTSSAWAAPEMLREEAATSTYENDSIPVKMSVKIDKIELAVEGHSKALLDDDRSLTSQDSGQEGSPHVRTYLVEICEVGIFRQKQSQLATTSLTVNDASILRLKDGSQFSPFKSRLDAVDAQYRVLVRSKANAREPTIHSSDSPINTTRTPIVRASLLHDGHSHLDEVEVDIDSVVLRVTPTTLKDCAKAFRRIAELTQLATKEMERKVHEEGRKARRKGPVAGRDEAFESRNDSFGRPGSPTGSLLTDFSAPGRRSPKQQSDSSILLRLIVKESTILAGRPTLPLTRQPSRNGGDSSYAVIQLLSNALIMFQSIENPDGTGSKTLHASIDNASALVNTEFERVPLSRVAPMIGPTGAEFRVVYATENLGCVVSQDISADCEQVKACMTPNDLATMASICRTMFNRMKLFRSREGETHRARQRLRALSNLIRYQKKGTGIATSVRSQVQSVSFVLLQAYKSHIGSPEFLDFRLEHVKMTLEGCLSALSGDCSTSLSVNLLNSDSGLWEYAVEPFPLTLAVDQMPDEIVLELSSRNQMQINLTGILLRDVAEMKFDFHQDRSESGKFELDDLSPTVLSTVGLRRATETPSIQITNITGFDLHVVPDSTAFSPDSGLILNGKTMKTEVVDKGREGITFSLRVAPSAASMIGERDSVYDLPVESITGDTPKLYLLKSSRPGLTHLQNLLDGRASPDTLMSEGFLNGPLPLAPEPIVEFCMHNQRLRSTVGDVYGIPKGCDLLSSSLWSPEDIVYEEDFSTGIDQGAGQELAIDLDHGPEIAAGVKKPSSQPASPTRSDRGSIVKHQTSNWLRPYLKNDSPEWTDMTCTLRMARERVMLPDNNWVWVNDWSVNVEGTLGESTDADGFEYQTDFETFSRTSRDYVRGDMCRRRRWTRTRIVRPPRLDDRTRLLKFVWDKSVDQHGNIRVVIRSNVRLRNGTSVPLSFFVSSPSWDGDYFVGSAESGDSVDVPVVLASAVYLKIGRKNGPADPVSPSDCVCTENIMIIPTSSTSSNFVRTSLKLQDVTGTVLHFLVEIRSQKGIVDIFVEPVLRVVNLLPCLIDCQLGEVLRPGDGRIADNRKAFGGGVKQLAKTEVMKIPSGEEASFTAVSPWKKPHISLRVPGYQWSLWYRIVNRKSSTETWRPAEDEEAMYINSKDDADFADEFKSLIRFDRSTTVGDPLVVILSVECGHCPTLRIYSQYWVLDKTGFGCRFAEGFEDMLNRIPDRETSRRSHLLPEEAQDSFFRKDMKLPGHQWSIGAGGMSLYFSKREKLTLAIETLGKQSSSRKTKGTVSNWISPLDISNVMPKTVISLDELAGSRSFDLAVSVTVCPGIFSRTKLITLLPRYQIVNLLNRELLIAQDGCLDATTVIPSKAAIPFHWEKGNLPPKVRLGAPTSDQRHRRDYSSCWTNGRIRLDRVGITSMRIPTDNNLASTPMVVQAEVRLATKDQPSAVEVVIWSATERSNNPLYILRNRSRHTIVARQPLQEEQAEAENTVTSDSSIVVVESCAARTPNVFHCGAEVGPTIRAFLGLDRIEEFVWVLKSQETVCFGFEDPEKPHILEWSCADADSTNFDDHCVKAFLEVDAMGSTSTLSLSMGRQVRCQIGAEHSTKVIEFIDIDDHRTVSGPMESHVRELRMKGLEYEKRIRDERMVSSDLLDSADDEDEAAFGIRVSFPGISLSVVDNGDPSSHGREILLASFEKMYASFSQSREGYHEFEFRLMSFQVDNFVQKSIHPVLIFCPPMHEGEPLLHMSAVRRLQMHSDTLVFRYAALRLLEVEIFLDRMTAETVSRFIEPFTDRKEEKYKDSSDWVEKLTRDMEAINRSKSQAASEVIQSTIHSANSGRIYFEQLHLHPVRLSFTFTQEWMEWNPSPRSMMIVQFIRGMASIANAPLTFTSFVVSHVFEAPQALGRVVATHYSSQLTKQIFAILGSLAIFGAPADFITNVGTGVRDFFYEPINGAVHGPKQFIEGLEAGTSSLARGVFVGVVRGAANVTELVNANLVGLTADDEFIDERKAHQRLLTDAMSRGTGSRTLGDSLILAGASVARGVKSGALGIVEQPAIYASKHGPVGFLKGVGKALIGALVKPVVGVGDAAVLVMNHVSDATAKSRAPPKIPKRLRRALPSQSSDKPNCVRLLPYDERAAKAQKIVTGGESLDDVYIGHIHIPSHLIIASQQCLWAIDRRSRDPWCVNWEEISHFSRIDGGIRVLVFSKTGLKTYVFHVEVQDQANELHKLLLMHAPKMGNPSDLVGAEPQQVSRHQIPGVKTRQVNYIFGSCNDERARPETTIRDEIDLVEQCFARVKTMGSESPTFFKSLDEEAWGLITSWGHLFSGLSSKRCVVAGIINGTGSPIQVKSTKLVEGGSPCYTIQTKEYDPEQGLLHAGGSILFFGWGNVPNLLNAGRVFMHIETNGFMCHLGGEKSRDTFAEAMPGCQVGFLEKSYDDNGWWAKYWLLVRSTN